MDNRKLVEVDSTIGMDDLFNRCIFALDGHRCQRIGDAGTKSVENLTLRRSRVNSEGETKKFIGTEHIGR